MAIGSENYSNGYGNSNGYQSNGSQNSNKAYEATYYSRLRFKNKNDMLTISYRSGLMILDLGSIGSEGFKFNSAIQIFLSPTKAHLLVDQINEFLKYREGNDINPSRGFGVNTGMGEKVSYIAFSTDENKIIYINIGKFDGQGVITEVHRFAMNHEYNYSLDWEDVDANVLSRVFDENVEIIMLRDAIEDFSRTSSGAIGYAVADMARWDTHRMNRRIDQIFDKLGIERQTYSNGSRSGGSNNFLDNASSSSRSTSIEEMQDLLED